MLERRLAGGTTDLAPRQREIRRRRRRQVLRTLAVDAVWAVGLFALSGLVLILFLAPR